VDVIGQTCACGARGLRLVDGVGWLCGFCILARHDALEAEKNAAASWPPAVSAFGPGSVVVAKPGGLLDGLCGDRGASPG